MFNILDITYIDKSNILDLWDKKNVIFIKHNTFYKFIYSRNFIFLDSLDIREIINVILLRLGHGLTWFNLITSGLNIF